MINTKIKHEVSAWKCKTCSGHMSYSKMMSSHGVCPHCGVKSGETIVSCDAVIAEKQVTTFLGIPIIETVRRIR